MRNEWGEGRGEGLPRRWGKEPSIFLFPFHTHAASAAVERMPDFQQDALGVFPPLVIPKPQFFNALRVQTLRSVAVMQPLLRHAALKPVQLDGQLGESAEKVQKVFSRRVLPVKFKSRKTPGPQRPPELFLLVGLPAAKAAGVGFGIHGRRITPPCRRINAAPLPNPLPIRSSWGEGIKALDVNYIDGGFVSLRFLLMPCSLV